MDDKPKIVWIVNQYCVPIQKRTRQTVLSQRLEEHGYKVFIVCGSKVHGQENNLIQDNQKYVLKKFDGANFLIIKTSNYSGNNMKRVLVSLQFQYNIRRLMNQLPQPDVIISNFAGLFGNAFLEWKRKFKTKIIYDVLDLWPEDFIDMGYIKKESLVARILYGMEHKSYREADGIIFSFEGGKNYIMEKKWDISNGGDVDITKIGYLNNGVDLETVDLQKNTMILDDQDLDSDKFKVVYLGTIRAANNMGIIVEAAKVLQDRGIEDIVILVYGDGDHRKRLEDKVIECSLRNIKFKGRLPVEYAPNMLSRCNLNLFNFMNAPIIRFGLSPNKLFMYFASSKPVLSTVRPNFDLVESKDCGIVVDNEPSAIADGIIRFSKMNLSEYNIFCKNCRAVAEEFDYKNLVSVLVKQIES